MRQSIIAIILAVIANLVLLFSMTKRHEREYWKGCYDCLAPIIENHHLKRGLARFWFSNYLTAFIEGDAKVVPYNGQFIIYKWLTSKKWIGNEYDFVVLDLGANLEMKHLIETSIKEIGQPDTVIICSRYGFMIYDETPINLEFRVSTYTGCDLMFYNNKVGTLNKDECIIHVVPSGINQLATHGPYVQLDNPGSYAYNFAFQVDSVDLKRSDGIINIRTDVFSIDLNSFLMKKNHSIKIMNKGSFSAGGTFEVEGEAVGKRIEIRTAIMDTEKFSVKNLTLRRVS